LGRLLTIPELIDTGAGQFLRQEDYDQNQLTVINNDPQEIQEAVCEMDDRLKGVWKPAPGDDERQQRFENLLLRSPLSRTCETRASAHFLRHYETLLEDGLDPISAAS